MKINLKIKIKTGLWAFLVMGLGIFFVSFISAKINSREDTPINNSTTANVIQITTLENITPESFYFNKDPEKKLKISALAYTVADLETEEIILAKEQDKKFPIASVSKLMTAILTENLSKNEDETTTINLQALKTYGQNGNLHLNEKIKLNELLYPLLLESSNDAAEAIALHFGRNEFLKKMNEKAKEIGLTLTSFEDPSGLSAQNQSTSYELFKLAKYIRENQKDIFEKTTKKSYLNKKHKWFSNNQFLRQNEYEGGKSGYTDPARQTVIATFALPLGQIGNRHIGITLLQSPDRKKDVETILKYLNKYIYYGKESDKETAWVKQKYNIPEEIVPDFVKLSFAGDIMLDRGVKNSVLKNFGGDYSILFDNLKILKNADIAFANLEGPVSNQGKDKHNLYSFRMDPSITPALKGAGIDIVSVANNHVGDWGREAYVDTLANLKENEILYTGGGNTKNEAEEPTIVEKYGLKIGYLGFSDKGPIEMEASQDKAGLLLANNPRFDEIIKNASQKVDYLVVSFHFGEEYQTKHNARQEYLAHQAIDAGAKIVVGHHPHVIEDTEVYKNGFIIYSLGNFIFDQAFSANTMQGLLLEIKLKKDGSMFVTKNIVKLSRFFQPDKIIKGKEEKVKLQKTNIPKI